MPFSVPPYSTSIPILRAVPSTILQAASTSLAFKSGILYSAILRISSFEIFATFTLFGVPDPFLMFVAFFNIEKGSQVGANV